MDGVPFLFNFLYANPRHFQGGKNPDSVNCRGFIHI